MEKTAKGRYFSSRVRRDPNGDGWRAVLYWKGDDGKVHERSRKVPEARTEAQAAAACERWRCSLVVEESRALDPIPRCEMTVGELVAASIEERRASRSVERRTIDSYEMCMKRVERGGLAEVPLADLTYDEVQRWLAALMDGSDGGTPLSNNTVRKTLTLLKSCTSEARRRRLIAEDPCEEVRAPKNKKKKQGINSLATPARAKLVTSLLAFEPSRTTCAAMISLYTGLRVGEICGLQWGDLDDFSPVLWVRRAVSVASGGSYIKLAKTDHVRDVAVPNALVRYLKRWREVQRRDFWEQGCPIGPETYVIGTVGGYTSPDVVSHDWPVIARAVGVKGTAGRYPTFHDLRHTWITMYLAAGGDVMTAASNAGHSSPSMTLDIYASADPAAKAASREVTERAMFGGLEHGGRPGTPSPDMAPGWFESVDEAPGGEGGAGGRAYLRVV